MTSVYAFIFLFDDSALYVTKLVEIGNGRDSALRQANSKYLERENKYTKEQIVELGESKYLVQSEKSDENFTVAPSHDARQRALNHYVALAKP